MPSDNTLMLLVLVLVGGVVWWWVQCATWAAHITVWATHQPVLPAAPGKQRIVFAFKAFTGDSLVWPGHTVALNPVWWWLLTVTLFVSGLLAVGAVARVVLLRRQGWRQRARESERWSSPLWAGRDDLESRRWVPGVMGWWLGESMRGNVPLVAPAFTSVQVVAPTRVGKTAGLVVQNILRCTHSLVVISSKADVVELTGAHRATLGRVYVFDPTDRTGMANVAWSVLGATGGSFASAKKIAQVFVESVGVEDNAPNSKFWAKHGADVMAGLLRAATLSGAGLAEISQWLNTQDTAAVAEILEFAGETAAAIEWRGVTKLPPETRGGVFATAQMLFSAFADPEVVAAVDAVATDVDVLDVAQLVNSGAVWTLYIVCPDDAARRVRPLFEALLGLVLQEGYDRHLATRAPLDPPMGVVLEEAGNIAAPMNLDVISSSYAGAGMPFLTVWQDSGQIEKHYGRRARTVVANHTTQVLMRGNLDDEELRRWSTLIGKHMWEQVRHQSNGTGASMSMSIDANEVEVATPDFLRQLPLDAAVIVSGAHKPVVTKLTPWFRDDWARKQIPVEVAARYDRSYGKAA